MEYREVLRYYLDREGITAAELCRRMGKPRSSIGQIMSGKTKNPSVYKAKEIADALGVPLQEMLDMLFEEQSE